MTSIFDNILGTSADVPVNPLFSSSSKFKAATAAEGWAAVSASPEPIEPAAARDSDKPAAKATKAKKRKAAAAAEPSEQPIKQKKQMHVEAAAVSGTAQTQKKRKGAPAETGTDIAEEPKPTKKVRQQAEAHAAPVSASVPAEGSTASGANEASGDSPNAASSDKLKVHWYFRRSNQTLNGVS